ncbi:MarR family transcriptional regulator [Bacillus mangrovi]|uniref:MarR family transcriptional regulator n=1 Tax=Metabacillus mangrovi TaxID=1491830 RepID=A0A7X2S694_9BACI|nr:MarR family transcriptional regulator [Metabacillus mangrovi]MTH54275.1 MarR family transcriptional regulator [Metabacillus mangrovi]
MEKLLIEFIQTLEDSLTKIQSEAGVKAGTAKLTINQFHYIDAVHQLGNPTLTEVAERMNFTKASVTAGLNKLISMGYVKKVQSQEDKRVFHVSLTEDGTTLIDAKYQALKKYGEFINGALSKEEAEQLQHILGKLVKLFK